MNNLIKMAMLHNWTMNTVRRNANCNGPLPKKQKVENCDWHTNRFFNFISHNFDRLSKFFSKIIL